jgi:hypothetical protein
VATNNPANWFHDQLEDRGFRRTMMNVGSPSDPTLPVWVKNCSGPPHTFVEPSSGYDRRVAEFNLMEIDTELMKCNACSEGLNV